MPEDGSIQQHIGATNMQLQFLKDALRDQKSDIRSIMKTLEDLREFRSRVLAYAGIAAAGATFGVQFLMEKVGG